MIVYLIWRALNGYDLSIGLIKKNIAPFPVPLFYYVAAAINESSTVDRAEIGGLPGDRTVTNVPKIYFCNTFEPID